MRSILESSKEDRVALNWNKCRHKICKLLRGQRVRIYYNRHLKCLSIQDANNTVIAYVDEIRLRNVRFNVRSGGLQRARESGVRNVHAYAEGVVVPWCWRKPRTNCRYNPFEFDSFVVRSTERPVDKAAYVHIQGDLIFIR